MSENPYSPPKSLVADIASDGLATIHPGSRRRPFLVWLVAVPAGLSFLALPLVVYVFIHYWTLVPEESKSVIRNISTISMVFIAITTALNLVGVLQLFRIKRSALHFYSAKNLLSVTDKIAGILTGRAQIGSWGGVILGFGFSFTVW